jgi:hypothetical protein
MSDTHVTPGGKSEWRVYCWSELCILSRVRKGERLSLRMNTEGFLFLFSCWEKWQKSSIAFCGCVVLMLSSLVNRNGTTSPRNRVSKLVCSVAKARSSLCQLQALFLFPEETTANRAYLLPQKTFSSPLEASHISLTNRSCTHMDTPTGIMSVIWYMFVGS